MTYWHYTNGTGIHGALKERMVSPRSSYLSSLFRDRLRPIVWFSRRPTWEPAATRSLRRYGRDNLFMESLEKIEDAGEALARAERDALAYGGLYRIGVDIEGSPLRRWPEFAKHAGMSERVAGLHEEVGGGVGSDSADWAASLDPIPTTAWDRIEWWSGDVPTGAGKGVVVRGPGVPTEMTVAHWGTRGKWISVDNAKVDFIQRMELQRLDSGVCPLSPSPDGPAFAAERDRVIRDAMAELAKVRARMCCVSMTSRYGGGGRSRFHG